MSRLPLDGAATRSQGFSPWLVISRNAFMDSTKACLLVYYKPNQIDTQDQSSKILMKYLGTMLTASESFQIQYMSVEHNWQLYNLSDFAHCGLQTGVGTRNCGFLSNQRFPRDIAKKKWLKGLS